MSFVRVLICYTTAYKMLSKSDYGSLKYGNITIFKMAVIRHFEFMAFDWIVVGICLIV